jgi:RHS repeat-associated protein
MIQAEQVRFMKRIRYTLLATLAVLSLARPVAGQTVEYYHLDALGSVRVVTNASGAVIERHDYLPFGEEWNPPASTLGQPLHFSGKERDKETGLDYFGARYYGSQLGRFTTVDPAYILEANLANPQRWNKYSYALNNPLRFNDPDGRLVDIIADIGFIAYDLFDIGRSVVRGHGVSGTQLLALGGDVVGAVVPALTGVGQGIRLASKADDAADAVRGGTEVVQRAMSRAELQATLETGLVRGGREGTHYVSPAISSDARRARQRLALKDTPEVRVTMEVPSGRFSPASTVRPANGMPGGGRERAATGQVRAVVKRVDELNGSGK